jgi:hypothetical protein
VVGTRAVVDGFAKDGLHQRLADTASRMADLAERTGALYRRLATGRDRDRRLRFAEWEAQVAEVERRNAALLRDGRTDELEVLPPMPPQLNE